jgi:tripartite-type tricarboxylate transporter receptor subunit TctC
MRWFTLVPFLVCATAAFSQAYPTKPIRVVVTWAAGGTTDVAARIIAKKVSESWPQQMVVENRPGAGGTIGAASAAKSAPDGYSLILGSSTEMVVSPHVYKNVGYNTVKDFVPIAYAGAQPMVLTVNPQLPVKSVPELIAYAKSRPATLNSATAGNGSTLHLAHALFESVTGVKLVHVPYSGSPQAAMATVSGESQVHFGSLTAVLELVRGGKLRGLAVTGSKRVSVLPDLPTLQEAGLPTYDIIIWNALFAPQGTPADVIERLQTEVNRVMTEKEVLDAFARLSMDYAPMSRPELANMVNSDWTKLGKIVAAAGMKVD